MFRAITLTVALLASGCCASLPEKAIATTQALAAGNDRYTELVQKALEGKADLKTDNVASITSDELAKTPPSVRILINALLESLHVNRNAAHSVLFQLDKGPDPATLGLKPLRLPAKTDLLGGH